MYVQYVCMYLLYVYSIYSMYVQYTVCMYVMYVGGTRVSEMRVGLVRYVFVKNVVYYFILFYYLFVTAVIQFLCRVWLDPFLFEKTSKFQF
jgi:hypothetical protein